MVDDVLPSRGPEACLYAERCPQSCKSACLAGGRCRHENILLSGYISSATEHYSYAKSWLQDDEYQQAIKELGVISLQLSRLSARLATEGSFDACEHGISKSVATSLRYGTALHGRRMSLVGMLRDPETAAKWLKLTASKRQSVG